MIKVTIFGGHEGRLNFDTQLYFTVFGSCEVVRPTLARMLVARRQSERGSAGGGGGEAGGSGFRHHQPMRGNPFFFTLFGSSEVQSPTLADEFIGFHEAINGGVLTPEDCDRSMGDPTLSEVSTGSFTLFGSFEESSTPSENEEIDSLAIQRHLGNISERVGRVLQLGFGQSDGERRGALRQAVLMQA